jgi:hypothetical protein
MQTLNIKLYTHTHPHYVFVFCTERIYINRAYDVIQSTYHCISLRNVVQFVSVKGCFTSIG